MKTSNPLVVIPTYNEAENIGPIIKAVLEECPRVSILVVDDNSPDGTGRIVEAVDGFGSQIHLLSRKGKEGLGRAYIAGFEWGLAKNYSLIVQMDADFSHRPKDLSLILDEMEKESNDFAVGSRWVPGGATVNWGLGRRMISRGGSFYARNLLGFPLSDWTGGFNAWRPQVLKSIGLEQILSNGYSFQVELKYKALKAGYSCKEIPIIFEDRRVGQSKMSSGIVFEAMYKVWQMKWDQQ